MFTRLTDDEVERKAQDIIGAHPNTYTFTKNLAESMLAKETEAGLPLVIVRPTIISMIITYMNKPGNSIYV